MFAGEKRRTVRQWVAHLEQPDAELTLEEFAALTLLHIRENTREARLASEHLEGMVGAIDQFAASVAHRSGIEYAASGAVRAALDARRDDERRKALAGA